QQLGDRGRAGAQARENRRMFLVRSLTRSRGVQMRCADDSPNAAGGELLQNRQRRLDAPRAIVDAGQEVRVDVDHSAALAKCAIAVGACSAIQPGTAAPASNAYVTSASALSRSSAASLPASGRTTNVRNSSSAASRQTAGA